MIGYKIGYMIEGGGGLPGPASEGSSPSSSDSAQEGAAQEAVEQYFAVAARTDANLLVEEDVVWRRCAALRQRMQRNRGECSDVRRTNA